MEQYFSKNPSVSHHEQSIEYHLGNNRLVLATDNGVFSKGQVDFGSKVLVETVIEDLQDQQVQSILELGSGYGPIVLMLAKHYSQASIKGVELNERAFELSKRNAENNQLANVNFELGDATQFADSKLYDLVVTNPPIRAGKATIQAFVNQAHLLLKQDGHLYLVIQKKQGAPSMEKHMMTVFGNVEKVRNQKGYWILKSTKE